MDIRSKKEEPIAYSEDQEDELLSIVAIKGYVPCDILLFLMNAALHERGHCLGSMSLCCKHPLISTVLFRGTKAVVGTQLGILSIFNRNKGWGDCVDRVPG